MKTLLLLIVVSTLFLYTSAQQGFQKLIGTPYADYGYSIQQTSDGGYIMVGGTTVGTTLHINLIKTDANLDTLWTRTFGGSGTTTPSCVRQTIDGGYIISGSTDSFGVGMLDVYLVKTDATGNLSWSKTYGGAGNDYGNGVEQTSDGGYILACHTGSFGAGGFNDAMMIKTNSVGDTLWTRTFGGSLGPEFGYSVQEATDHGFVLAGATTSFGVAFNDVYLVKTDSAGTILWSKTYGGTEAEAGNAIRRTNDGGYLIIGVTGSFGSLNTEIYAVRINANGDTLWTKTYGENTGYQTGNSLWETSDNGFIIGGYTSGIGAGNIDVYLVKIDQDGAVQWSKTYGGSGPDYSYSVISTSDGGFLVAGRTENFGATIVDAYIIKTDALGNSGCQETDATIATIALTPHTLIANAATVVMSGSYITTPTTIVGSSAGSGTLLCTTGIETLSSTFNFKISPNPSSGNCMLTTTTLIQNGLVEVYNMLSEKVYSKILQQQSETPLHFNLASGMYIVKLTDDANHRQIQKLIVD